jgi:hypothetical protein
MLNRNEISKGAFTPSGEDEPAPSPFQAGVGPAAVEQAAGDRGSGACRQDRPRDGVKADG